MGSQGYRLSPEFYQGVFIVVGHHGIRICQFRNLRFLLFEGGSSGSLKGETENNQLLPNVHVSGADLSFSCLDVRDLRGKYRVF